MSTLRPIEPELRIGAVHLAVSDLTRSVAFYQGVIGLTVLSRDDERAELGAAPGAAPLYVLTQIPAAAVPARESHTGLFHVAVLVPDRRALGETLLRIARARWPLDGASDHGVSEAIYLPDPDGLGVEVYRDRPREQWPAGDGADQIRMYTLPLDLRPLLDEADAQATGVPAATTIGHVHLRTSDLERSVAFYRDAIGLDLQAHMPGAAFLAADGYHHHIGLNTWGSLGAAPPPADTPGLREVELLLSSPTELDMLAQRLGSAVHDGCVEVADPDENALRVTVDAPAVATEG